jgi:hypothetical protein
MDKTINKFDIRFGGISGPISEQLRNQGLNFKYTEINTFQLLSDSIKTLVCHGIIPAGEAEKARKRLFNKIQSHIKSMN